jgi:hypothetical protein
MGPHEHERDNRAQPYYNCYRPAHHCDWEIEPERAKGPRDGDQQNQRDEQTKQKTAYSHDT